MGLVAFGIGVSGWGDGAVRITLISLSPIFTVVGVLLPRAADRVSIGRNGITFGLSGHEYVAMGPAITQESMHRDDAAAIRLGDVLDALLAGGFTVASSATGKSMFVGPEGQEIILHTGGSYVSRPASESLLELVGTWKISPVVNPKYLPDRHSETSGANEPYDTGYRVKG